MFILRVKEPGVVNPTPRRGLLQILRWQQHEADLESKLIFPRVSARPGNSLCEFTREICLA